MNFDLKLAWCDFAAAKYAVEYWHYSHSMPAGKLVKVGVWEHGAFIGCVIFGRGANNHIGTPYRLKVTEICELVRIALLPHVAHVTRIMSIAIRMLRNANPGIRLVVSYADPRQSHVGVIYQAGNWIYTGKSNAQRNVSLNGAVIHKRSASSKYGSLAGV